MNRFRAALVSFAVLAAACQQPISAAETTVAAPAATLKAAEPKGLKVAVFAGGCFWGVEGVYSHVKGVSSAVSGYHGGTKADASYSKVSGGVTSHAESVKITYDPAVVRYDQLLQIFFSVVADPTTLNYQGPDHGAHYRTAIVPTSAEQGKVAKAYLAQLAKAGLWTKPIVTKIETHQAFYPAEDYHQDFILKNPRQGYIVRWDLPKIAALKVRFPALYRASYKAG